MKKQIFLLFGFVVINLGLRAEETTYPTNVHCLENKYTIAQVKKLKPRVYVEIGISDGNTALAVSKLLPPDGEIYLFDFHDIVSNVAKRIRAAGFRGTIHECGNTYKYRDSYNWTLMWLLENSKKRTFDYVYLDGLHMWETDALTFYLVDKLLKIGGHIDFDDYNWVMAKSGTCKPELFPLHDKMWTREQMSIPSVKKIVDLLVVTDGRYKRVQSNSRSWIFKKVK